MSDTEILDAMEKHAIQLWPETTKVYRDAPKQTTAWIAFAVDPAAPGNPVQATRLSVRAVVTDVIEELRQREEAHRVKAEDTPA